MNAPDQYICFVPPTLVFNSIRAPSVDCRVRTDNFLNATPRASTLSISLPSESMLHYFDISQWAKAFAPPRRTVISCAFLDSRFCTA